MSIRASDSTIEPVGYGLSFPVTNLKAEAWRMITDGPFVLTAMWGVSMLFKGYFFIGFPLLIAFFIFAVLPVIKRLYGSRLHLEKGELTIEIGRKITQVAISGSRLTHIQNAKFNLLLPDGQEFDVPLPTEWTDSKPIGSQFLYELRKAGCLVDAVGWRPIEKITENPREVEIVETLAESDNWYQGNSWKPDADVERKTKFAAVQTIIFSKGRIQLRRRGYEIFNFAYSEVKVDLLYGIDRKKRGYTRLCLIGPGGERHFLNDWKRGAVFAGENSDELVNNLTDRGIKIHRDPYELQEYETSANAH